MILEERVGRTLAGKVTEIITVIVNNNNEIIKIMIIMIIKVIITAKGVNKLEARQLTTQHLTNRNLDVQSRKCHWPALGFRWKRMHTAQECI